MRYAGIIKNDFNACPGVAVTLFTQGCPHRCDGCHNPEAWELSGGRLYTRETEKEILEALTTNGIKRDLCIMGGEPLIDMNFSNLVWLCLAARANIPDIKIYLWSGYTYEEILKLNKIKWKYLLKQVDYLIDGRYVKELRDITLPMRGSSNQRILELKDGEVVNEHWSL